VISFVVPGDIDDMSVPSGGNVYDRRMCQALGKGEGTVREISIAGSWPKPDDAAKAEFTRALAELADGSVVVVDGLVACGVPEVVVPEANRLRLVVLVHLPLADETGLARDVAADLDARERETLHAASAVIATSPWAARRLTEHHSLDANRVHAVPPGTDPAPLAPGSDGRSRLLCVAAVTRRKGLDLLIEALGDIKDLPFTCDCVGSLRRDPAYVHLLSGLIEHRGLSGRVSLTGPRIGADLEAAYASADLLVLPSHTETYGMVLTEALARGIPVLATNSGAIPETVGHAPDGTVPGILTSKWELAGALRDFLTSSGLREQIRAAAQARRATLSTWDQAAQQLAGVLAQVQQEPACI
jgi:glycosyltransferase involved in cell wall biosynthesis